MGHKIEINSLDSLVAAKVKTVDGKGTKTSKQRIFITETVIKNFISHLSSSSSSSGSIEINIPSGRYQVVSIDSVAEATHKRNKCFKFKLSYLQRNKDLYSKADKNNLAVRSKMQYKLSEYPVKTLYFIYFPKTQEIVADSRCLNNVLTRVFIEVASIGYKQFGQHGLTKKKLKSALRISIKNILKDNFNDVLKNGGTLKELSFSFKKPSESKKAAILQQSSEKIYKELNEETYGMVPEILGRVFNVNTTDKVFDRLPTSRVKITITPDDAYSNLSNIDKKTLKSITENDFLSTSSIRYTEKGDDDLKRAFIRGVAYSYENSLNWDKLDDDKSMFKELLKHYDTYKAS